MRGSMEPCLKFRLKQARVFRSGHAATLLNLPPIFQPPEVGGPLPMEPDRPVRVKSAFYDHGTGPCEKSRTTSVTPKNAGRWPGMPATKNTGRGWSGWRKLGKALQLNRVAHMERQKRLVALDRISGNELKCA